MDAFDNLSLEENVLHSTAVGDLLYDNMTDLEVDHDDLILAGNNTDRIVLMLRAKIKSMYSDIMTKNVLITSQENEIATVKKEANDLALKNASLRKEKDDCIDALDIAIRKVNAAEKEINVKKVNSRPCNDPTTEEEAEKSSEENKNKYQSKSEPEQT